MAKTEKKMPTTNSAVAKRPIFSRYEINLHELRHDGSVPRPRRWRTEFCFRHLSVRHFHPRYFLGKTKSVQEIG